MADDRAELEELRRLEELEARAAATTKPNPVLATGLRLGGALMTRGPAGLIAAGAQEGMQGLDKAGAVAGDFVSDTMSAASGRRSLLNPLALDIPPEASAAAATAAKLAPGVLVGGTSGAKAGAPVMEKGAKFVMQSAMKPTSKSIANGEAAKAIDTMLDEGVNVTMGGAVKLRHLITKLKGEVGNLILKSPATVDKNFVYKELASKLDDVAHQGTPKASMAAVQRAWDEFKNHPLLHGGLELKGGIPRSTSDKIPIQLADELKRGTQKVLSDAYKMRGVMVTPADEQAQMAIASGLRKGMEAVEPRIAPMNAKLSEYITALHQIEPRAAVAANRDLGGLVPLASSPEAAMLMLADRNPWLKSYVARVLYQGRKTIPATAGAMAGAPQESKGAPGE